jgi:hypothetical protein
MNATHLKTMGGRQEEKVAGRLRKPVSGTVASSVGPASRRRASLRVGLGGQSRKGADVDSSCLMRCRGPNPMRVVLGREAQDGWFGYIPSRRVEPHERNVRGVASSGKGRERNTGKSTHSANVNVIPGVSNPMRSLLPCPLTL